MMRTGIAVYVPHHQAEDYRSQGREVTPLTGNHAAYSMLATREDGIRAGYRDDVPRTIEQAHDEGV